MFTLWTLKLSNEASAISQERLGILNLNSHRILGGYRNKSRLSASDFKMAGP